jgi:hypothetical protein
MDFLKAHFAKKASVTKREISRAAYLATTRTVEAKLAHNWRRAQSLPYNAAEKVELNQMIAETTAYLGELLYSHREGGGFPLSDEQATKIALVMLEESALLA